MIRLLLFESGTLAKLTNLEMFAVDKSIETYVSRWTQLMSEEAPPSLTASVA